VSATHLKTYKMNYKYKTGRKQQNILLNRSAKQH